MKSEKKKLLKKSKIELKKKNKGGKKIHPKTPPESSLLKEKKNNQSPENLGELTNLQSIFRKKLEGARFRSINERLYTIPGAQSFEEFQRDPSLYDEV